MLWNGIFELFLCLSTSKIIKISTPSIQLISEDDSILTSFEKYEAFQDSYQISDNDTICIEYSGFIKNFYEKRDKLSKELYYIEFYDLKDLENNSIIKIPKIPVRIEWIQPKKEVK